MSQHLGVKQLGDVAVAQVREVIKEVVRYGVLPLAGNPASAVRRSHAVINGVGT